MTLETILEKRNTANVPLTVVVDGISMSRNLIRQSDSLLQQFAMQDFYDNCDCTDCGDCYCNSVCICDFL